jgi:hypothetical protein
MNEGYAPNTEYGRKLDEARYAVEKAQAGGPGVEMSAISAEMNRLHEEVERILKLAYTLADRLTPVLAAQTTKDVPPGPPTSVTSVPMVGHIEGMRRTVSEGAKVLIGILDRLAL